MDFKILKTAQIIKHQGKQFIPDLTVPKLPEIFKNGRAEIAAKPCKEACTACADSCPTDAINLSPVSLDLGKCVFCIECVRVCVEDKIKFTNDHRTATNDRNRLVVREGVNEPIELNPDLIREEISDFFHGSLKLRQVCAAGENSTEWEINASENVNFDMGRFGINFVASPRHADGLVLSGPISENMAAPLEMCYHAISDPKLLIVVGVDAISGGIFQGSPALERSFLDRYKVDLYVPGNPPHPLTFILGILEMIRKRK